MQLYLQILIINPRR